MINLSKRFFVTVPDVIGDALDRWAESERNKPASLAAFLLERAVRDAMDAGKIPAPKQPTNCSSLQQVIAQHWDTLTKTKIPSERLQQLRDGDDADEVEILRICLALNLDEDYLSQLMNRGGVRESAGRKPRSADEEPSNTDEASSNDS